MITQADIGELVAKLFDRMPEDFPDYEIQDALLLVELRNPEDPDVTSVTIECTNDRLTVMAGILEFGQKTLFEKEHDDE